MSSVHLDYCASFSPLYYFSYLFFFFDVYLCHFSAYFHMFAIFSLSIFCAWWTCVRYFFHHRDDIGAVIVLHDDGCYKLYNIRHYNIDWLSIQTMTASPMIEHLLWRFVVVINIFAHVYMWWWRKWEKLKRAQPQCAVFVGHLRMYYKCGVRLFKHPAHDYLINCFDWI